MLFEGGLGMEVGSVSEISPCICCLKGTQTDVVGVSGICLSSCML